MADFGPPIALTEDDFLDVLTRNFADHWISRLLEDPSSRSFFIGAIAQILRIQIAEDENFDRGTFILTAPGAAHAVSTVRLFREGGGPEVTLLSTHQFLDDRGALWLPIDPVTIPLSGVDQTIDIPIRTDRYGYYLNSFEPLTYQSIDDLPDPNFEVQLGVDPATDGTTAFLDQHGKERKVFRVEGESDSDYAHRIRFLEDQVSPKAIAETAISVLDAFIATKFIANLAANFGLRIAIEPFLDTAQFAQRGLAGDDGVAFYDDDRAYFDDPAIHFRDLEDSCAWFDIYLPAFADPDEARLFYDDGYFDDPELGFPDLGPGVNITAPLAALADELDRRRAHCVGVRIFVGEDSRFVRFAKFDGLVQLGSWTDQDGNTTGLDMANAVATFDGDASYVVTAAGAGAGAPLAAGDLVFNLPGLPAATPALSAVRRVILRARVRKSDLGVGDPDFAFLFRPSTAGAPIRLLSGGFPVTISSELYEEFILVLDENPISAAAWIPSDVTGTLGLGVANTSAGATDELRVSELSLEVVADFG